MITLYRVDHCYACDEVEERLRDLVIAHNVVNVEKERPAKLAGKEMPVIVEGNEVVSGEAALHAYLAQLTRDAELWRKYQSDVCYVDEEGNPC
jgi:hypothetical protein